MIWFKVYLFFFWLMERKLRRVHIFFKSRKLIARKIRIIGSLRIIIVNFDYLDFEMMIYKIKWLILCVCILILYQGWFWNKFWKLILSILFHFRLRYKLWFNQLLLMIRDVLCSGFIFHKRWCIIVNIWIGFIDWLVFIDPTDTAFMVVRFFILIENFLYFINVVYIIMNCKYLTCLDVLFLLNKCFNKLFFHFHFS